MDMGKVLVALAIGVFSWSVQAGETRYPVNPALNMGGIYVAGQGLIRFDAGMRKPVWKTLDGAQLHEPVADGGRIYVGGAGGLYGLDGQSGEELWHLSVGSPVFSPVKSGNTIYLAGQDGVIRSVSARSGKVQWSVKPGNGWIYPPVVSGGLLITGGQDGTVWGLDAGTGVELWAVQLSQELVYRPLLTNSRSVLVTTFGGDVITLDLLSGNERWRKHFPTPSVVSSMTEQGVVLGSMGGVMRLLSTDSGDPLWQHSLGSRLVTPVSGRGGRLMAITADGLYRHLDAATGVTLQQGKLEGDPLAAAYISDHQAIIFSQVRNNFRTASVSLGEN